MALWLSENDIEKVMESGVSELVVRFGAAYRDEQGWDSHPRIRHITPFGNYQYMGGVVSSEHVMGVKTYVGNPKSGFQGVVVLFDYDSGELLTVMGCDILGRWRTGAASAVAAAHFAGEDAVVFGLIGSGRQAMTQLAAVNTVCEIVETKVHSRDVDRLRSFCREAESRFGIPVTPVESAENVVAGADIISTVTPAKEVVLRGAWIDHPCHINAVGANGPGQQELDSETFSIADMVAVDNIEQAREECGDLIAAVRAGTFGWDDVLTLRAAIKQRIPVVCRSGVTIFESQGIAAWDLVAAAFAYSRCLERNLGKRVQLRMDPDSFQSAGDDDSNG